MSISSMSECRLKLRSAIYYQFKSFASCDTALVDVFFMEKYIIKKIEALCFLSSDSESMDELSKDLNDALDASSDIQNIDSARKLKCRTHTKTKTGPILGSYLAKSSLLKSDDSESSLDIWIQGQMDFSTNGSYHHTDTDDKLGKLNSHEYPLTAWRQYAANLGESDSLNENFNQSRESRRKRKFKRMTVDPPYVAEKDSETLPCVTIFSQKSKRLRNLKSSKMSKLYVKSSKLAKIKSVSQLPSKMKEYDMDFKNTATSSGKRKRCAHERSVECNGCDCKGMNAGKGIASYPCRHLECSNSKSHDFNSSGLSSSESECEVLTNDESREADDEHSDFFQESGPTYGVPSFSHWWDDDDLIPDDDQFSDKKFAALLSEKYPDLQETAKKLYAANAERLKQRGRQIRSGRRRLGNRMVSSGCNTDEIIPYQHFSNEDICFSASVDSCLTKTIPNEKKKRKKMPSSVSVHGFGEIPTTSIPETSLGFQALKNIGWIPSTGLGRSGEGIISPVKTSVTDGKRGLGFVSKKGENILSSSAAYASTCSPPPPPPSPQSLVIKKENHV
ncbi:g-patch domain-containing protein [Nephila pilipes]|uniref:G-patch domain-containing protein n=1 Tax=Nephila pilipes TaxID=299642 RepID=A0A8X6NMI7_NEPPI|nr:g-patch domain-containing protein [Nephila pilipes]